MNYQQARLSTLARTVYSLHSRHVIRQHGFLSSGVSCRRWSSNSSLSSLLQPSEEVATALATGAPVVALESTIISHGMPYPQNLTTAQAVEDIVREHGCTPATIAILGGKIRVGLSEQELDVLAQTGHEARKTSRRDIAYAVSKGIPAATTVASTMIIAHLAGIPVFVTGGIGGVHRGAEHTMDISADLTELGRTPVAVICAGAKSILDIEKTLEYLETQGVTVATYGSDEFPAFFTPYSGFKSPIRLDTTKECASLIDVAHRLQLASGQVIAVPIPEKYAANGREIQTAIDNALAESVEQKITGKDATPFLLDRVNQRTAGKSLDANIALIKNNAVIGSQIARELALLRQASNNTRSKYSTSQSKSNDTRTIRKPNLVINNQCEESDARRELMIIGGCAVDITCTVFSNKQHNMLTRSSYPGQLQRTLGGVGCNIARVAHQCGIRTNLVSITGDDADGYWIRKTLNDMDISCQQIQQTSEGNTAVYNAIHEADGQLYVAVADMNIFDQMRPDLLAKSINVTRPAFVCFDGNIPVKCMQVISESCAKLNIPVLFEPTSVPKSLRILQDPAILACGGIQYITPNHHELEAMIKFMERTDLLTTKSNEKDELLLLRDIPITWHTVAKSAIYLSNSIPNVIVKLGEHGVLCVHRIATTNIKLKHYPSLKASSVVNVTGAGDSFVGALVAGLARHGSTTSMDRLINIAQHAAIATLASHHAVSDAITPQLLDMA